MNTKFSKTFSTWFFPVGGEVLAIVTDWISHLRTNLFWGESDPLFPATLMDTGPNGGFVAAGLKRQHWGSAEPIRRIFRHAFELAGLPYFKPHSIRDTLAQLGERSSKNAEIFKAWSQNLGHENMLTTFTSYGTVPAHRQAELIRGLGAQREEGTNPSAEELLAQLALAIGKRPPEP